MYLKLHLTVFFLDENLRAELNSDSLTQTQDQPQTSQPEPSGGSNLPDLADRSSQSSFTSQDGAGKHQRRSSALRVNNQGVSDVKLMLSLVSD